MDLSAFLEPYGFSTLEISRDSFGTFLLFGRGETFITILITNLKDTLVMKGDLALANRSKDWGIDVRLGQGGFEYLELQWSSLLVKNSCRHYDVIKETEDYPFCEFQFNDMQELKILISCIKKSLIDTDEEFLKNNLLNFYIRRSKKIAKKELNKVIIENTLTGEIQEKIDESSLAFKERYVVIPEGLK